MHDYMMLRFLSKNAVIKYHVNFDNESKPRLLHPSIRPIKSPFYMFSHDRCMLSYLFNSLVVKAFIIFVSIHQNQLFNLREKIKKTKYKLCLDTL